MSNNRLLSRCFLHYFDVFNKTTPMPSGCWSREANNLASDSACFNFGLELLSHSVVKKKRWASMLAIEQTLSRSKMVRHTPHRFALEAHEF